MKFLTNYSLTNKKNIYQFKCVQTNDWLLHALLPLLPGPLWSGVVAPDRVLSMDQIELLTMLD